MRLLIIKLYILAVDEKSLLLAVSAVGRLINRVPIFALRHGGSHASSKPVMRIEIAFHGTFHVVLLLNLALPEDRRVVIRLLLSLLCLDHRGSEVVFKLVVGGVRVAVIVLIAMVEEGVRVEEHLVDYENDRVATEDQQLWQREDFLVFFHQARIFLTLVLVNVHSVPCLDHLGRDMHESNGEEDAAGERVGDTKDFRTLTASEPPGRDHARDSRLKKDYDYEGDFEPEDAGVRPVLIVIVAAAMEGDRGDK